MLLRPSQIELCMLTNRSRLSHAGSFLGFPPSLILCSSPSGLGAGSYTGSGCWWRVGTCLDLLCWLGEAETDSLQREWGDTPDQQFARVKWPTRLGEPCAAPADRLLLMSTRARDEREWRSAPLLPRCLVSVKTSMWIKASDIILHQSMCVNA